LTIVEDDNPAVRTPLEWRPTPCCVPSADTWLKTKID
jgi:hypothetical protein